MTIASLTVLVASLDDVIASKEAAGRDKDFEAQSVRGQLENGAVAHFQVTLKVGFRLESA